MIFTIIHGIKASKLFLPIEISGSYYIYNINGDIIATIFESGGKWNLKPANSNKLQVNGIDQTIGVIDKYINATLTSPVGDKYHVYGYPSLINEKNVYQIKNNTITIGRGKSNTISFNSASLADQHATLTYDNKFWTLETNQQQVYINDIEVKKKRLLHGDVIFIHGLKIIPVGNKVIIYNLVPGVELNLSSGVFEKVTLSSNINEGVEDLETEKGLYEDDDYFIRAPRFKTALEPKTINISAPPQSQEDKTQPALLTIGPRLTMSLSSALMIFTTLSNVTAGNAKLSSALPSLVISVVMMVSSFLWPALSRKYKKKENRKSRLEAFKKYRKYLERKEKEIKEEIEKEKQIALENNVSLEACQQIIFNRKRNLWERNVENDDFLTVRLGIGSIPPNTKIDYKEADFSTDDNLLIDEIKEMVDKYKVIENIPMNLSLFENNKTAILGTSVLTQRFINSLMLQLFTFQSYDDLKVVLFTNETKIANWEYLKISPHAWDNQKTIRFIGTNQDDIKSISQALIPVFNERLEKVDPKGENATLETKYRFKPHYLIIVDDLKTARKSELLKKVLDTKVNLGFSVLFKNDRISNLPSEVSTFINIDEEISGLFENELIMSKQKQFKAEFNTTIDIYGCVQKMANIPILVEKAKGELPDSISFLDMYKVGRVEQLNALQRWQTSNPINSLSVPIGIDQDGDLFTMDAHENAYGPHGLIAGTTGSGKSEWIMTYILSLAVSFSPLEVQFVIIDYKGGGLAGSFENKELGIRLPHLVGTITNLDKSEIRRTLASLDAELKRRQICFNEAREKLKDSSMNIHKYQDYYRKGLLSEPMSHLFIISDEFAELKSQEPEFLDQLVSTARIGRSLGVHLILATQKPSGVVNDQIWSNARFHVSLRVQDVGDSNEMIKTPDAAYLKNPGAFYLQVGNNEFYGLGQSAYAGYKYIPSDIVKKEIDTDIHIVGPMGNEIHTTTSMTEEKLAKEVQENLGEQLLNILKYVDGLAKQKSLNIRRLWLDSIPPIIFVDYLKKKYNFKKRDYIVEPIVGEYDDPFTQSQHEYKLPITQDGNIIIYGRLGSGKENLLQTILYSLSTTYTLQEIETYIIDCGGETLRIFENNPIVGNFATVQDEAIIDGILKYVRNQMIHRKNLFAEYGGNYEQYIKSSGKHLPNILVIINNYTAFNEAYENLSELLSYELRDSYKYGITFIITNVQTIPSRVDSLLPYKITLSQDDDYKYREIMGERMEPANYRGRGLIKVNGVVYEFQSAVPVQDNKLSETIKKVNEMLTNSYKTKVPSVPFLPEFVTFEYIHKIITNMEKIPVGISKLSIVPTFINFKKQIAFMISSKNSEMLADVSSNLIRIFDTIPNEQIFLLDPTLTLDEFTKNGNITYVKSDFDATVNDLHDFMEEQMASFDPKADPNSKEHTYVIINRPEKFMESITRESIDKLEKIVANLIQLKTLTFIFIENGASLRTATSEAWMQKLKPYFNGLWVGNGVNEQTTVEVNKYDIRPTNQGIPENYGYAIQNGSCTQVKLIENKKEMRDN